MSATEQELKQASQEGAQKELQLRNVREEAARVMGKILDERKWLLEKLAALDKQQSEMLGYGDIGVQGQAKIGNERPPYPGAIHGVKPY